MNQILGMAVLAIILAIVTYVIGVRITRKKKNSEISQLVKNMAEHDGGHICLPWYETGDGRIVTEISSAALNNVSNAVFHPVTLFEIRREMEISMDGTINDEGRLAVMVSMMKED